MQARADDYPDLAGMQAEAARLIEAWETYVTSSDQFTFGQAKRRPDAGRFVSVYGLAAHVFQLAGPAIQLISDEHTLEAVPLVRLMFESSVTAVWLAQNEEGGRAFMNKEIKSRRALGKTLASGTEAWMRGNKRTIPMIDDPLFDSGSDPQASTFEQLCADLEPGGAGLYIHYRLLSRLSHPTATLVDRYAYADDKGEFEGLRRSPDRGSDNSDLVMFYALASLVWSTAAITFITHKDPQKRSLRRVSRNAARAIGLPRELHLTFTARQRVEKSMTNWRRKKAVP